MDHLRWAHLPLPGGLYDQDPEFLEQLRYIFTERDKQREKEEKERESRQKNQQLGRSRVAGGRR